MLYDVLAWLLAAFFLVGAGINAIAPGPIRADYERWGYPVSFRYVTAILELGAALFLVFPGSRPIGAALGFTVMAAAVATTLFNREPRRAVAPFVVLVLTAVLGWSWIAGA